MSGVHRSFPLKGGLEEVFLPSLLTHHQHLGETRAQLCRNLSVAGNSPIPTPAAPFWGAPSQEWCLRAFSHSVLTAPCGNYYYCRYLTNQETEAQRSNWPDDTQLHCCVWGEKLFVFLQTPSFSPRRSPQNFQDNPFPPKTLRNILTRSPHIFR